MSASGLWRAGLNGLKRRSPAAYARARNGIALAGWYWQRARRRLGSPRETFDAAFWDRHAAGDWDGFAAIVAELLAPRAVADVGCGQGLLLAALARRLPSTALVGVDDSEAAASRAKRHGISVVRADLAAASSSAIDALRDALGPRDLTICLEVAEHLPSWHAGRLLRLLAIAPRVLFSAATPNQGGELHVNERPAEYWHGRFGRLGYGLSPLDDEIRRRLRGINLPPWYAANVHLYEVKDGHGSKVPGSPV